MDLCGLVKHMCGTIDVLKVILRLFSALVSKCHVTLIHLVVVQNRFGTCVLLAVHIWGSILGHPVHSLHLV